MRDLVDTVGLAGILAEAGIDRGYEDFEEVYSSIHNSGDVSTLKKLEDEIQEYFSALELPDEPCLYDYLVLSLRDKDIIATFNWDPLLVQAIERNQRGQTIPSVAFLHGNVCVGHCPVHKRIGHILARCPVCKSSLKPSRLLYPIQNKGYNEPYIKTEWDKLTYDLKNSSYLTIIGYSAPSSDVEAIRLMKEAWDSSGIRQFSHVEIVDLADANTITESWRPMIYADHSRVYKDFHQTTIAFNPRRSIEASFRRGVYGEFVKQYPIPQDGRWNSLIPFIEQFVAYEKPVEHE